MRKIAQKIIVLTLLAIIFTLFYLLGDATSRLQECSRPKLGASAQSGGMPLAIEAKRVIGWEINDYRDSKGLRSLSFDEGLYMSAAIRAQQIYTGDSEWSHDGWTLKVSEYYGYYLVAGENLAQKFDSDQAVIEAWKKSPTHNDVLLNTKACDYGFARFGDVYVLHIGCKK